MKIVVIGGTGFIGSRLVTLLKDGGHEVIAASPKMGVNSVTGEGLAAALVGTAVVVDVSNSPTFDDAGVLRFFETSGHNLMAAEKVAGVKHHVVLSIVGTDQLLVSGYFRGKMAQETIVRSSGVPFTIVRATQFFEFLAGLGQGDGSGAPVRLTSALLQPVAAMDVVAVLGEIAEASPRNGIVEVAGPETFGMAAIVGRALAAKGEKREIIVDDGVPYYGVVLGERSLVPGAGARVGKVGFGEWVAGMRA